LYEEGDNWVYDVDMSVGTLRLSGRVTYMIAGESSMSAGGFSYDTYEMDQYGSFDVSGTIYESWASGTATLSGSGSMDQDSLDLIVSDQNLSISVTAQLLTPPLTLTLWDHIISTYSPPSGTGQEPEDIEEGVSWTKNYTIESVERSFDSWFRAIASDSYSYSSTSVYNYIGSSPTIVPSGTFECNVVMEHNEYGVTTSWMSEKVGMVVKSEYHPGSSDSITQLIVSHSHKPLPTGEWSPAMVITR